MFIYALFSKSIPVPIFNNLFQANIFGVTCYPAYPFIYM